MAARSCARLIWVRPKSRPASCRNWRRPLAEKNSSPDGSRALLEHGAQQIPRKIRSGFRLRAQMPAKRLNFPAIIPRGSHPFPSRTRKLSLAGPMVLHGKLCGSVGRRRSKIQKATFRNECGLFHLLLKLFPISRHQFAGPAWLANLAFGPKLLHIRFQVEHRRAVNRVQAFDGDSQTFH